MQAAAGTGKAAAKERTRRRIGWRRVALLVHNWLGLKLMLVLSIVLLSGTLAVFRYEIDWLLYSEVRVSPAESLAGLDDIVAAVRSAYPDMGLAEDIPTGVGTDYIAMGIVGVSPERGIRLIRVDPYRAVVLGDTPLMTPGFFLATLHRDLFIPEWGLVIVCTLALVMTLSLVTGLLIYRRFWRGFLLWPRGRNPRILVIDLHRLVGLWSLWLGIVIALTSLWYFWTLVGEPKLGLPAAVERHSLPEPGEARLAQLGPEIPQPLSLDAALARVTARYPDFIATYLTLPEHHGDALVFHGSRGELLAENATAIAVDPYSGDILGSALLSERPLLNHIGAMVNPLHYGYFGGLLTKTLWFVFGLGLTGVAVTGVVFFWLRSVKAARGTARPLRDAVLPWKGAMGWFKPLNWLVVAVSIYAAVMTAQFFFHRLADAPAHYPAQAVGPWDLGLTVIAGLGDSRDARRPDRPALAVVHYCTGCWDAVRRLWVHIGPQPPGADQRGAPVSGRPGFAFAPVLMPPAFDGSHRLWIVAEGWDGISHTAAWPLGPAAE